MVGRFGRDPKDWTEILPKLQKFLGKSGKTKMEIAHNGELIPYDQEFIRRWVLRDRLTASVLGSPGAGKSTTLRRVGYQLNRSDIPYRVHREETVNANPLLMNVHDINAVIGLRSVARLVENEALYRGGGRVRFIPNFSLYERGPFNAIPFSDAFSAFFGGKSVISNDSILDRISELLDIVAIMRVEPSVTLDRGGKMTKAFLDHLDSAHDKLPHRIADISRRSSRPLVIATIDATGSRRENQDLLLNVMVTLVHDAY